MEQNINLVISGQLRAPLLAVGNRGEVRTQAGKCRVEVTYYEYNACPSRTDLKKLKARAPPQLRLSSKSHQLLPKPDDATAAPEEGGFNGEEASNLKQLIVVAECWKLEGS